MNIISGLVSVTIAMSGNCLVVNQEVSVCAVQFHIKIYHIKIYHIKINMINCFNDNKFMK